MEKESCSQHLPSRSSSPDSNLFPSDINSRATLQNLESQSSQNPTNWQAATNPQSAHGSNKRLQTPQWPTNTRAMRYVLEILPFQTSSSMLILQQESVIQEVDLLQNHGNNTRPILLAPAYHPFPGIGAADITKLKGAGFYTIASCLSATRRNLAKIKGFSEQKVEKIKEAAMKCAVRIPASKSHNCIADKLLSPLLTVSSLQRNVVSSGDESARSRLEASL